MITPKYSAMLIVKHETRKEKVIMKLNLKAVGTFAGGVLFGTAGIKILTSRDAKKVYTNCTAAVLRAKECVMKNVELLQENCEDIYADAKDINEQRIQAEEENTVTE